MSQRLSRRSALKIASSASLAAAWLAAGCTGEPTTDPTIKTEAGKSVSESVTGVPKKGRETIPGPKQRVTGRPE